MTPFWDEFPPIPDDLARVRRILLDNLSDAGPVVSEALTDLALRPGKMLRPAFVVLAARVQAEASRGRRRRPAEIPDRIYRIAAAVEMLHMATLIHDDVIDDADTRRGDPTLNRIHGSRAAVLMGDVLFSRCFSLVSGDATMENARLIASGVSRILTGEIAQAEAYDLERLSIRDYNRRIIAKTALLFALCFHVGASEMEAKPSIAAPLRRAGYDIGMGFQVVDDILDLLSTPDTLGKPVGADLAAGVVTLPVILALREERARRPAVAAGRRNGSGSEPIDLRSLVEQGIGADMGEVVRRVEVLDGFSRAKAAAVRYTDRAVQELRRLPEVPAREILLAATGRLLSRRF